MLGNYNDAFENFEKMYNAGCCFVASWLGQVHVETGKRVEALEWFLKFENHGYKPYLKISRLYLELGNFEKSIEYWKKKAQEYHPLSQIILAALLIHQGRKDEAISLLKTSGEQPDKFCHYFLSLVLSSQVHGADRIIEELKKLDYKTFDLRLYQSCIAGLLISQGNVTEGLRWFDEAVVSYYIAENRGHLDFCPY